LLLLLLLLPVGLLQESRTFFGILTAARYDACASWENSIACNVLIEGLP
jgi:hypothetical protein